MQSYRKNVFSGEDPKIEVQIEFDSKFEVFTFQGRFEDFEAKFRAWITRNTLELLKGDYFLQLEFKKNEKEVADYFAYLPYCVNLNSQIFLRDWLTCNVKSYQTVQEQLKIFFENGRSLDFEKFDAKTKQHLEVLIFGYFTFKRFTDFLKRNFENFYYEIQNYGGKPASEIMDVFKSANMSLEELKLELTKAVSREDFERATFLRDKIRQMQS